MNERSIVFQFVDQRSAYDAFDTLEELGYRPVFHTNANHPMLHIHVDHSDITSALEIAQAHGGAFVDESLMEHEAVHMSYQLDDQTIVIPAHVVNEDWSQAYGSKKTEADQQEDLPMYEPDESYDHISADVRI